VKKLWPVVTVGIALSGSAAFATDLGRPYLKAPPLAPAVAPGWTGFYIGIDGGFGWSQHTGNQINPLSQTGDILKPSGGLAGGQIGYNWQSGIVVYGVEADIQWAAIKDSAAVPAAPDQTFAASDKLGWFGTVRARLGITPWSDNALLYVTGGLIYGGQKVSGIYEVPDNVFARSVSTTRTGGTVGAGLEYRFTSAWSGKIEGLWYDMGSTDFKLDGFETVHFHFQGAIARAGLNYHFTYGGSFP
jgi:outer membrane immunogenic protein